MDLSPKLIVHSSKIFHFFYLFHSSSIVFIFYWSSFSFFINLSSILIDHSSLIFLKSSSFVHWSLVPAPPSTPEGDREVSTEGKVLAVGCEAGRVSLIDVRSREVVKFVDVGDAVNVVRWAGSVDGSLLAVGCENGRMVFLDTRKFDASSPTAVSRELNSFFLVKLETLPSFCWTVLV